MTRHEYDVLAQLAQDVGYIRGQIDIVVDARLPDRMTFVEGQQKVQNERIGKIEYRGVRFLRTTLATTAALAGIASAIAAWAVIFH